MADDPFEDLLELEDKFFQEGYAAGVADSTYAGLLEGKVFGIEKGYEKAVELGRLRGRTLVWSMRTVIRDNPGTANRPGGRQHAESNEIYTSSRVACLEHKLPEMPRNTRLTKHVASLLVLTDGENIAKDNSDEAVSEFDDRLARARAKAKVIANVVGEHLNPATTRNEGIEDTRGINARH